MPCGWGSSILGGGTTGPWIGFATERAGDDGEYHHSRNLIKKIAVGSRTFNDSRSSRGDLKRSLRNVSRIVLLSGTRGGTLFAAAWASRYVKIQVNTKYKVQSSLSLPSHPDRSFVDRLQSTIARVDKRKFSRKDMQCCNTSTTSRKTRSAKGMLF